MKKKEKILGFFSLAFLAVAAVFSLRSLSIVAVYGWSVITLYGIAALAFFLPSAYVSNRLTLQIKKAGGLYAWVREAFGDRLGLLGIWFEWINTVVSFPAMVIFAVYAGLLPFLPHLEKQHSLQFVLLLILFWGVTFMNYFGIKISSKFVNACVMLGIFIPALLIIGLALGWVFTGHPVQIIFSWHALIPNLHFNTLAFLMTIMTSLSGIQAVAFHSQNASHLQRDYPRATLFAVLIILFLLIVGASSIAIVTPPHQVDAIGGLMVALQIFLKQFNLSGLIPFLSILIAIGVLAEVNVWLISPSRGLLIAAQSGQLPKFFRRENRHGAPSSILLVQAMLFSLLSLVYLLMPTLNSAYWLITSIFSQLTLLMWILVFASAIKLCARKDIWKVAPIAGIGLLTCLSVFMFGFLPSSLIVQKSSIVMYEALLISGIVFFAVIPTLWVHRGRSYKEAE